MAAAALASSLAAACSSSTTSRDSAGTEPTTPTTRTTAGQDCVAACGGIEDLDCAVATGDCGGGWCLVDVKTTGTLRTYCTNDCSAEACEAGFHCGDIDVMGIPGPQKGCIADAPVCGDGVRQLGEVCERGERSETGAPCRECTWDTSSLCGNGRVEAGEACEEDTSSAFCNECQLAKPQLTISSMNMQLTSERWDPTIVTHTSSGKGTYPLPNAGGPNDCQRYEIVESTAELVRLELTSCDTRLGTKATWRLAIPRNTKELGRTAGEAWKPSATLERMTDGASIAYDTLSELEASVTVRDDHRSVGSYSVELTKYAFGGGGKARLELDLALLPAPPP